jgi:rhodanese-related sulfurtransferase
MKEDYEFQGNLSLSGSFRCPLNTSNLTGWGEFMSKEFYKDQTYVIYCARGNDESQVAATKMGELGFKNVYYLIGGFLRWKLENYSWG